MNRTFCDRCGKDLALGRDGEYKDYPFMVYRRRATLGYYRFPTELHLCKNCQKDLRKWFLMRQSDKRSEKKLWRLFRKTHDKS